VEVLLQLRVQQLKDHQVRVLTITETPVAPLAHKRMKGRNGCFWSSNPIGLQSVRRSVQNLVTKPGRIVPVKFSASLEDCFKLLVSEEILEIIVHHTNDMLFIPVTLVKRKVK